MVKGLSLFFLAVVLSGCVHGQLAFPIGCDPDGPWRPKRATVDFLYKNDPAIADRMNAINRDGAKNCNWKP
jgi:hypothetical protein